MDAIEKMLHFDDAAMKAQGVLGRRLVECLPDDYVIENHRGKCFNLGLNGYKYQEVRQTVVDDLRNSDTQTILRLLARINAIDKTQFDEIFRPVFEDMGRSERFKSLLDDFPEITQAGLAMIASINETTVGYRLTLLESLGLISRRPYNPPRPRLVIISETGWALYFASVEEAYKILRPDNDITPPEGQAFLIPQPESLTALKQ
jgi:hypothetical protein